MKSGNVHYWRMNETEQNFGDSLSWLLINELFLPHNLAARGVHLIGSVIHDMFVPLDDNDARPVVFWGCGLREDTELSPAARNKTKIYAVRGPLTASSMKLGDVIGQGDPGFLIPALYPPVRDSKFALKSVCMPHFHDSRSDDELLDLSGCDFLVRPNISGDRSSINRVIDVIYSSNFVLTSSLHGAIIAAAYGRPFAFWNPGFVDLPFKWKDLAQFLNIPVIFATNHDRGIEIYNNHIKSNLNIPSMIDLIATSPLPFRISGLLKVLDYEIQRSTKLANPVILSDIVRRFADLRQQHDEIGENIYDQYLDRHNRCVTLEQELALTRAAILNWETKHQLNVAERVELHTALSSSHDQIVAAQRKFDFIQKHYKTTKEELRFKTKSLLELSRKFLALQELNSKTEHRSQDNTSASEI